MAQMAAARLEQVWRDCEGVREWLDDLDCPHNLVHPDNAAVPSIDVPKRRPKSFNVAHAPTAVRACGISVGEAIHH